MNRNERLIVRVLVTAAAAAGYALAMLDDGEDRQAVTTADRAIELGCNLGECQLLFKSATEKDDGWVSLIFSNGNDGLDVISDYHTNLTFIDGPVDNFIERLAIEYQGEALYVPGGDFAAVNAKDKLELAAPELKAALDRIISINGSTGGAKHLVEEFKTIARLAIAKLD